LHLTPRLIRRFALLAISGSLFAYMFTAVPAEAATTFRIHNVNASGKCIGIDASFNGGEWYCTNNADQTFHWAGASAASGFSLLENNNGWCLGTWRSDATFEGDRIIAKACDSQNDISQGWKLVRAPTGYYIEDFDGLVIGVASGSTANGAALVAWVPITHSDQYWALY